MDLHLCCESFDKSLCMHARVLHPERTRSARYGGASGIGSNMLQFSL